MSLFAVATIACNAESPTALADFNPASIHGDWALTFSGASCAPPELQMSFTQFSNGGALPELIRLIGSWQTIGDDATRSLEGELQRDTGVLTIQLLENVRILEGIVLDVDNLAFGYRDVTGGCSARAAARRIE